MVTTPPLQPSDEPLVLVVEEDEDVRNMLSVAFPHFGFAVLTAPDGKTALERYREHKTSIQLVLMGVNQPGLSGTERQKGVQQEKAGVRCFFMSADRAVSSWQALASPGAMGVLPKPFSSLRQLAETLRGCLGKAATD